jgi:hypothetical protein
MVTEIELLLVAGLAVLTVPSSIAAWYYSDEKRARRALRTAPRRAIGEARAGRLEKFTGRVSSLAEPLRAPLSGRRCVHYVVTVEEKRSSGGSAHWETVLRDPSGVDFLLEDGTGRARVVNKTITLLNRPVALYGSATFNYVTPEIRAYLATHGLERKEAFVNESMRCLETVLEERTTAAVMGEVSFEVDPGGMAYREMPRRVVVTAPQGKSILASDDPDLVPLS